MESANFLVGNFARALSRSLTVRESLGSASECFRRTGRAPVAFRCGDPLRPWAAREKNAGNSTWGVKLPVTEKRPDKNIF